MSEPEAAKTLPGADGSPAGAGGKVEHVVTHCVHAIATGQWPEGHRLPSVREAEGMWSVSRLTVLKAYQRLAERGLVRSEPRSGYFVAAGPRVQRMSRHRVELDRLYDSIHEQIRRQTDLSPAAALEYLAELARARARAEPECAFVECTRFQAEDHAAEVSARLGVPCLALTIDQLGGNRMRVPKHVHTLLTTGFHRAEVAAMAHPPELVVAETPLEFSRRQAAELAATARPIVMLGIDSSVLAEFAEDLGNLLEASPSPVTVREVAVEDLDGALMNILDADSAGAEPPIVLLSSTLWESADPWHDHPQVIPIRYQIRSDAWSLVADALGLPLGVPG